MEIGECVGSDRGPGPRTQDPGPMRSDNNSENDRRRSGHTELSRARGTLVALLGLDE